MVDLPLIITILMREHFFKERADNTSMNPAETFAPNQDVEEPEVEERDESVYDNIEIFK